MQQRKNGVSIEKLLATNQLHALLKNITPAKSPQISLDLQRDPENTNVSGKQSLVPKSSVKPTVVQRLTCDNGMLSKDSIKVIMNFFNDIGYYTVKRPFCFFTIFNII